MEEMAGLMSSLYVGVPKVNLVKNKLFWNLFVRATCIYYNLLSLLVISSTVYHTKLIY